MTGRAATAHLVARPASWPDQPMVRAAERPVSALARRRDVADLYEQPFVLGYVHEATLVVQLAEIEAEFRRYADVHGFRLGSTYVDRVASPSPNGFQALMAAIERYDVSHVLVPSLNHVQPIGRESKKAHLEHWTKATVLTVCSP